MHHTVATLAHTHDHRLVLLAIALCVFGAITAMRVLQLAMVSGGRRRLAWFVGAAIVGGCTIWSTHFISMLSYNPGMPISYDLVPTFLSLTIAVVVTSVSFAAMMRREAWAPYIAGVLFGSGVAIMHYVGMSAVQVAGRLAWNVDQVALSFLFGMGFGLLALAAIRNLPGDRGVLSGSAAFACSVLFLHFTGMGAATVIPDPSMTIEMNLLPPVVIAAGAAVSTCFVLTVALLCVVFDRRMTHGKADAERRIHHLAFHDSLTGLPNRTYFGDRLRESLDAAAAQNGQVAVLAIDLDRFKQVNDIFGHQAGDGLLRTLSDSMSAELRGNEMLARVGGDEFVIVQCNVAQPEGADDLAKRLLTAVCRDVEVEGFTFRAAMSIGIALYPRDGKDAATLHPNADAALYRAKQEGRGGYRFFEPEMDMALRERRALQVEMRDALKRKE